jgi:rhodanese-related sulfurtransferase
VIVPLEPRELARRLASGEELVLLDVREPFELEIARLDGAVAIPLGELAARADELDPEDPRPLVCVCHHGIRSAHAAGLLASHGFERVYNLTGGIDRWASDVDPSMERY